MKAIVQSCDMYHCMTEHMILKYESLWPDNPFVFRVPWNNQYPNHLENRFGKKIELIKTNSEFKQTFHQLTQDLDDHEWVYWCIDDKYLIDIDPAKANQTLEFVRSIKDPNIINVCFHFIRQIQATATQMEKSKTGLRLPFKDLTFIQHNSFKNNWLHQFFRVGALREFWSYLPEPEKYKASPLDQHVKPLTGVSMTLNHNICTYGESTYQSVITNNCLQSFQQLSISAPDHFFPKNRNAILNSIPSAYSDGLGSIFI